MAKTQQPDDKPVGAAHAPKAAGMTEAELKAWVRREIAMASHGATVEEREVMNP
jgi:hypothetical protein